MRASAAYPRRSRRAQSREADAMKVAICNIGQILSGDIAAPIAAGDTIILDDGKIVSVGTGGDAAACDVAIDAGGMMAMPGLIDSHVHITFGDYTPRQKTVGFLESYIHGGVTTCISASEVHVPGRPRDPAGVKALGDRGAKIVRALPSGRHARSCRLGHPRAGSRRSRFRRARRSGRVAGESRLRRLRHALRLRALSWRWRSVTAW